MSVMIILLSSKISVDVSGFLAHILKWEEHPFQESCQVATVEDHGASKRCLSGTYSTSG